MVSKASGGCCESIIDCLESGRGCCETHLHNFTINIYSFGSFRRLLLVHHWWIEISRMFVWNHLYTFTKKMMVVEASGGCYESIINGLESPGGCCEAICTLLTIHIESFTNYGRLLWIHYWWFGISWKLPRSHLHTFTMKYLWIWISRRLLWSHWHNWLMKFW